MKLLLHACCGPCTIEPLRLLLADGHDITIAYANSNIQPRDEYEHRLAVLQKFAQDQGIEVVEGVYDVQSWRDATDPFAPEDPAHPDREVRANRCRACYALRLREAAAYAQANGFEALGTTLAVSPYQYSETVHEELVRATEEHGLVPVWQDYRPYYPQATRESRALGMYRQNYCGCLYSIAEAREERAEAKRKRAAEKARRDAELAPQREAAARAAAEKRAEKQAYAKKRAAQRAALKEYKRMHAHD